MKRRDFLKIASGTAVAIAAPSLAAKVIEEKPLPISTYGMENGELMKTAHYPTEFTDPTTFDTLDVREVHFQHNSMPLYQLGDNVMIEDTKYIICGVTHSASVRDGITTRYSIKRISTSSSYIAAQFHDVDLESHLIIDPMKAAMIDLHNAMKVKK